MGKTYRAIKISIRITLMVLAIVIMLPLAGVLLLQIPAVQNFTKDKVTRVLSEKLKVKVQIERVSFGLTKDLVVEGIYLEDQNKDTLLYAQDLKANLSFLKLLKKEINLTYVSIENARLNAYRPSGSNDFNFTFILNAFADTTQKNTSAWKIDLGSVSLERVKLRYHDTPGGIFFDSNVNSLTAEFKDLGLENNHLAIRKAAIEQTELALVFKAPEIKASTTSGPEWTFSIEKLDVTGSGFIYNNYTIPAISDGVDYNRMRFSSVTGSAENIEIKGKDLALEISTLALNEKSGFVLDDLEGKLSVTEQGVGVEVKELKTPHSRIDDPLQVFIPLGNKEPAFDMKMEADWKDEKIAIKDLLFFVPELDTLKMLKEKTIALSGKLKGTFNDFELKDLSFIADKQTVLKGDFRIKDMTRVEDVYAKMNIQELRFDHELLSVLIPAIDTIIRSGSLGNIRVKGSVEGYLSDASIDLRAVTDVGNVSGDVRLRTDTSFKSFAYSGSVTSAGLDLEKALVSSLPVKRLSMSLTASGENAEVKIFKGKVAELEYNNYTWQNIQLNGSMLKKVLNMELHSDDKNFISDLSIKAYLNMDSFLVNGTIAHADLQVMNFVSTPLLTSAVIKGQISGTHPDSLQGTVLLTDATLDNTREKYMADSVMLNASLKDRNHIVSLEMPEVSSLLSGAYSAKELPRIIGYLLSRYQEPDYPAQDYPHTESVSLDLKAGDLSKLMRIVLPDISAFDSLNVQASYKKEGHAMLIQSSLKRLKYKENNLENIYVKASGSDAAINFLAEAQSVRSGENLTIDQTRLTGDLSQGSGLFKLEMFDQRSPTHLNVDGIMVISQDTFNLNIPSAEIVIRGNKWNVDRNNSLVYTPGYLVIEDFMLTQGEQKISIDSRLTSQDQIIEALLENVHLHELSEAAGMSSYKLQGDLNGKITINDPAGSQEIKSKLTIDSLGLNNIHMGNLVVSGSKRANEDPLFLNAFLTGPGNEVRINGPISFSGTQPMDIKLDIVKLSLKPLEPFARSFAYSIDGKVSGNFKINGTASSPVFTGMLSFDGTNNIGLLLSNTMYKIENQKISFKESSVELNRFIIKDMQDNEAYVNGSIDHEGFKKVRLAMNLEAEKFQMINSKASEDALIYGQLFTEMSVRLDGPADDLEIYVDATTLRGSRVFLPLASAKPEASIPPYIQFQPIETDATDSLARGDSTELKAMPLPDIDYSNFNITGDLRITKDAEISIIVDPINGDKITARGDGTFTFSFDSENNINLYGVYTIDQGSYGFSFANLVRKNFKLEKGSTISWTGDFENAMLNINAAYQTKVSRYELIADQSEFLSQEQVSAARRLLPVEVLLNLTGRLLTPEITFSIEVPEGSDVAGGLVTQQINQINNSPNEVTRQAFSLIVLNRFAASASAVSNTGSSNVALNEVNQSVSRMLNNQLNQLSDDYLQGVDINVNIQSLDQSYGQLAQNAEVMVTKQFSDRISISAGGNVNINSNYGSGQFAGDYGVVYRVNRSGTINLKFFRTSTQNIYTSNLTTQSGASVNYKREFSRWSRLFKRRDKDLKKDIRSQN